jgi:integrase
MKLEAHRSAPLVVAEKMTLRGCARSPRARFEAVEAFARELCAGANVARAAVPTAVTFRQLAERWTSGELARLYPDHIKVKRSVDSDVVRLRTFFKTIGDVPLRTFSLEDAKRAMAAIPNGRTPATRRHYGQLIARLLNMAVFACELTERYPLPPGFLPKIGPRPALSYLYPAEDARLLACKDIPLTLRLLYGFLAREGLRLGEALELRWQDINFEHGTIRLERTKTGEARAWALDRGVVAALLRVRELTSGNLGHPIFPRVDDKPAKTFRAHLRLAGVTRAELFERTPHGARSACTTSAPASARCRSRAVAPRSG